MKRYFDAFVFACGLCAFLLTGVSAQTPISGESEKSAATLAFGESKERSITNGEKHFFKVHLEAGQFVRIEARPFNCDVNLMIFALDGKSTLDIKNDAPKDNLEFAVAAVRETGDYQVRVNLPAGAPESNGKYAIKIAELRASEEKEIAYSDGRKLMSEIEISIKSGFSAENARAAIGKYEQAIRLFEIAGSIKFTGVALDNIGILHSRLGDRRKSLEFHERALEKFRTLGDKNQQSLVLNSIGRVYSYLGNRQKAIEILLEAAAAARDAANKKSEAVALNGIGAIYLRLDDPERAEFYHLTALKKFEDLNDRYNQTVTLNYLGNASTNQKNYRRAVEYFLKAIEIEKTLTERQSNAAFLSNLGTAYQKLGEVDKAFEYTNQALNLSRTRGDKPNEAAYLQRLGNIYAAGGKYEEALNLLNQSLQIYRLIEDPTRLAETLLSLARVQSWTGNLPAAQTNVEEAIRLIEDFRSNAVTNEMRDLSSADSQDYYAFYVELLMRRHAQENNKNFAALALQSNERARARSLLNLLNEANIDFRANLDEKIRHKEISLKTLFSTRLENLTKALIGGKAKPEEIAGLKREIEQIRAENESLQSQIRAADPRYAALTQPKTLSLQEIQTEVLDADSVLLEYALGETKSFLWIVTKNDFRAVELPAKTEIEQTARAVYESLTARNKQIKFETPFERDDRVFRADSDAQKYSRELGRMILAPVAPYIENKKLLIVADGALQYVPFGLLVPGSPSVVDELTIFKTKNARRAGRTAPEKYLIETNEIVNLPSASVLAVLRRETVNRNPAPKTLAILADPIFERADVRFQTIADTRKSKTDNRLTEKIADSKADGGFKTRDGLELPRLPFTRREAEKISSFVPAGRQEKLLDFAASRQSAISGNLSEYNFIHFATHGFINSENPELSGIILSLFDENGREHDGFLRVADIYNLKLPAEMVVLSGCKTGLGKEIKGEGLIGLTRGFMYAGARRMTVSLWDVNDEATAELMTGFYGEMFAGKKLSPAAALRQAQIKMIKDKRWNNPYFWATFILQGEPK